MDKDFNDGKETHTEPSDGDLSDAAGILPTTEVFTESSFEKLRPIWKPNGRCSMKRGVLKRTGEDVILKIISRKNHPSEVEFGVLIPRHPNVLQPLGTLTQGNDIALVSSRQDGDLLHWAKEQERKSQQCNDISIQMTKGLNHLHQNNIIHCDVALKNFLIKTLIEGVNIKIYDYELSRALRGLDFDPFHHTRTEIPWAHSAYEVLQFSNCEVQSDVHSLGISIWGIFNRKEPFEGRARSWLKHCLEHSDSAAGHLDMIGIPKKIKLLIECCTKTRMHQRPKMNDIISYLESGGIEHLSYNRVPEYFQRVIDWKKKHEEFPLALPLAELIIEDDIPELEQATPELCSVGDANQKEVALDVFFKKLFNPADCLKQQKDVDVYVDMCAYMGMSKKFELEEYLVETDAQNLVFDCFVLKRVHYRKLAKALFDDRQLKEFNGKVKILIKKQKKNLKQLTFKKSGMQLPNSPRARRLLGVNVRQSASNAGVKGRVSRTSSGSVIVTMVMTQEHLGRFLDLLRNGSSSVRSPTSIFRDAAVLEIKDFFPGVCVQAEEKLDDAFGFQTYGFSKTVSDEYSRMLMNCGVYNNDELLDAFVEVLGIPQIGVIHELDDPKMLESRLTSSICDDELNSIGFSDIGRVDMKLWLWDLMAPTVRPPKSIPSTTSDTVLCDENDIVEWLSYLLDYTMPQDLLGIIASYIKICAEFKLRDFLLEVSENVDKHLGKKKTILKKTGQAVIFTATTMAEADRVVSASERLAPHINVLPLLGTLEEDRVMSVVSRCNDNDLLSWVGEQKCDSKEFNDVAIQMARGLAHLHNNNIIHRDVALRNFSITLEPSVNIKIADLGLVGRFKIGDARSAGSSWDHCSLEVLKFGQFRPESDVYSFGISMWELFTGGRDPFRDNENDHIQLLERSDSAASLLGLDELHPKIKLLIECCTKKVTLKRPTMNDVLLYLEKGGTEHLPLDCISEYFGNVILKMHEDQFSPNPTTADKALQVADLPLEGDDIYSLIYKYSQAVQSMDTKFVVGDVVKASLRNDADRRRSRGCSATVIKVNKDGTFDVRFHRDGKRSSLTKDMMQTVVAFNSGFR